jgi:hypothetical protein
MSLGLRADPTNTSAVISVAGTDQVVITNAGNVTANTFTGALAGNASTATKLSTATVGTAPSYSARAWVSFDATRNVSGVADSTNTNRFIYGSANVTNVLRTNPGNYFVNFATAFPNADYAFSTSAFHYGGNTVAIGTSISDYAVNRLGVICYIGWAHDAYFDPTVFSVVIFR